MESFRDPSVFWSLKQISEFALKSFESVVDEKRILFFCPIDSDNSEQSRFKRIVTIQMEGPVRT
jgi:hypothetical protein